jgi:hypothetical protein
MQVYMSKMAHEGIRTVKRGEKGRGKLRKKGVKRLM